MSFDYAQEGFSLVEVMVAMVISGVALVGALGAVHQSSRHVQEGIAADRALTMVQGRLEAKRSVRWESLLEDDLDQDGVPDLLMKDDGQGTDVMAGDGIYSAGWDHNGIRLVWTLEADHPGSLSTVGSVTIVAVGMYAGPRGPREVRMGTVRANPTFVGTR